MIPNTELLEALDLPIYTTDEKGLITFYNDAAAEFWGHRPEIGTDHWCGSWRLFWPDGRPLPHDECPMAVTLREGREVRGVDAVAETPDGTRKPFLPYPKLLRDASGRVTGAINVLVEVGERREAEIELARLAAIVTSSDDAIISKTLDGTVTSWNAGAQRIFGYAPEEMIGRSIKRVIPPDLHFEEDQILRRLREGEHIDHYDTIRMTRDGHRIDISLTVSPLRDRSGKIIGASKVARDVTERKQSEELQRLLLGELNHRVKNTLAIIQAIANQSLLRAANPSDFVKGFKGRLQALGRAHDLLVRREMKGADIADIIREQVEIGGRDTFRISLSGPPLTLESKTAVQLALVLHELATNARKYGALSVPTGRLSISWDIQSNEGQELIIKWEETGVPNIRIPSSHGFGTMLIERTLASHGGKAPIRFGADGVTCELTLPLPEQNDRAFRADAARGRDDRRPSHADEAQGDLVGQRILLVEDEALIAMDIEAQLISAGCKVVGPVGTLEKAKRIIAEAEFDAALLDANLDGHPVHELAAALAQKGIPFAFSTGYGRENIPQNFQNALVLTKPFGREQLTEALTKLLERNGDPDVTPIWTRRKL